MGEEIKKFGLPHHDNEAFVNKAIDCMVKESIERTKKELPHLQEHVQKMQKSRGAGLESAIMSEQVIVHMLSYMGHKWDKIISLTYGNKINKIIKILEETVKKDKWRDETISNLIKMKHLRNIYAHVPADYKNKMLMFDGSKEYYSKGDEEFRLKPLEELNKIFENLSYDIQNRTTEILKRLIPVREQEKERK